MHGPGRGKGKDIHDGLGHRKGVIIGEPQAHNHLEREQEQGNGKIPVRYSLGAVYHVDLLRMT